MLVKVPVTTLGQVREVLRTHVCPPKSRDRLLGEDEAIPDPYYALSVL